MWKREIEKGEVFAILEDIEAYSQESKKLLKNETDEIIELKDNEGRDSFAEVILEV